MTDYHSHILPGMDDGSRSVEESLSLLREEVRQGIDTVVMTPHFYSGQNSPRRFLKRRFDSFQKLLPRLDRSCPRIILGAEVQFFPGISDCEDLSLLTIGQTKLLLLEMPFSRWDRQTVQETLLLGECRDVRVVLAHIDRYYTDQPVSLWRELSEAGILMQLNTSALDGTLDRLRYRKLIDGGSVHMLGSDCHNMTVRPPRWGRVTPDISERVLENMRCAMGRGL